MTEMAKAPAGLGQCAISNQPSFSIPFLYAYYGCPEKSNYYIKKIASECFTPDAYPGDEDNGSMSAWYIFATIGHYPICPGSGKMVKTTPLVKGYKILGK
jgi:putative alpha-1,2-mannosidase